MIHRSSWYHVAIYALLIAVVMLGLAFYLNDPICRNSASCVLMGVLGAAILQILLITSFATINARRRAKSVGELSQMARQVLAGENNARVLSPSGDEIGDLARVIYQMTDSLRVQIGELSEENKQLDTVLDNMADGVLITDDLGRVLLLNTAAAKMLNSSEKKHWVAHSRRLLATISLLIYGGFAVKRAVKLWPQ